MSQESLGSLKSRREYIMRSMSYTAGREGTDDTEHYLETMHKVFRQLQELDKQIAKLESQ